MTFIFTSLSFAVDASSLNTVDIISCAYATARTADELVHSYDDGVVTVEPGCNSEGRLTYTCTICFDSYYEVIPATGEHSYTYVVTDATCAREGKIVYTCSVCTDSYEEIIAVTENHDYRITVTEPTCIKDGYTIYSCSVCGDNYSEVIAATGEHDYGISVTEPTCSTDGSITYTCRVCGDVYVETVAATGNHNYEIIEYTEADCIDDGKCVYRCINCGHSYKEIIYSTGAHNYEYIGEQKPTCVKKGGRLYMCRCGEFYEEVIPAKGHSYTSSVIPATCTENGKEVFTCSSCRNSYYNVIPATDHVWGQWIETKSPTTTETGVETKTCESCGIYETRELPKLPTVIPTIADINNYTVTINGSESVKEIRFAIGTYTTGAEVKAAEKNITLDAATVAKYTTDGIFTYDLPWVGTYTFWVRMNDGSQYFLYTDVNEIEPYVTSYGVKLTVNDFGENYKDAWLAKGTFNSYSEIKASTEFKYQASATKLANYAKTTHDFTYTMTDPGDYTVLIRYNDGSFDVIHHTLTVDYPVLVENGLQVIVLNIPDIKIIRTAYGHYTSVADIKNATGVRNFNNKTVIKDAESYMIQYREEGEVTLIVEFNNGYKHYFYYNVQKKVPTYTLEGNAITFGDLDDLYIIRYAPGKYTTSNNIKNAPGSKYKKTADLNENGEIVIDALTPGRWSFMVQYNDESYNFYVLDVK